jgi:hypothetical protein
MGYGETNLKNWSYRSAFLLIVTGVLLISICSMSISYIRNPSTLASHITTAGGIFIFVAVVSIAVGCTALYKTNLLNILYLKVSSKAAERTRNIVDTQKQAIPVTVPNQPTQRSLPGNVPNQPTQRSLPGNVPNQPAQPSLPVTVPNQPSQTSLPDTVPNQPNHPIVFI